MTPGQRRKNYEEGGGLFAVLRWTEFRAGDEVCLHPCRIHQRVFEQTDSRRTPLSAINQQQRLSLSLSVCFCVFLCERAGVIESRREAHWWLCAKEDMIYCWQSLKVQSSKFNKDAVFIYSILYYLFPRLEWGRFQRKSTLSVTVLSPQTHRWQGSLYMWSNWTL